MVYQPVWQMSRTRRRFLRLGKYFRRLYRHPETLNERGQLELLFRGREFEMSNREKSRKNKLPSSYDDIVKSSYYEDYKFKHFHENGNF